MAATAVDAINIPISLLYPATDVISGMPSIGVMKYPKALND